ncbi:MAG: 16S rRNA (cytosine(967)-C(5))-methyltransferase RsmB [Gemmatimonadota bacterium]|nr:MAG: 16S rRNA (cytosine(967)-C(5))-methyltransferase RsmB [Gemmatimonadota bacterium]
MGSVVQGTRARAAALEILRRVRAGEPFDAAHDAAVRGLSDLDRRLTHEIAAGVLRGRNDLDRRLRSLVSGSWRRTPVDLKDLLRIGVYQITRLHRVPAHAAVQATVEVAKRTEGSRAAGLVNAVLRRVVRGEGDPAPAPEAGTAQLAESSSHPEWLVERWVRQYGFDLTRALLEHNNRKPPLVLQPVRWSRERLERRLAEHEIHATPAPFGAGLTVSGVKVRELPGYDEGGFVVQDAAQARVVQFAAVPLNATVWDACAAPGGKAAILSLRARVLATELRRDRIPRLKATLDRVAPAVALVMADAAAPPLGVESVDVALLDAPCSATGTLARHPDGRWRLSERSVQRAAALQRRLLDSVCEVVRPGGTLVYATCSLEPEENEGQVNRFLNRHPDYVRDCDDLMLLPPTSATDGAYAARLRRSP